LVGSTSNAYFVLDALPPYTVQNLEEAAEELIKHLKTISPNARIEQEMLSQSNLSIGTSV
jgi:DNA/RNA-binding domain of Phe-tRNA-synthetase-like protein